VRTYRLRSEATTTIRIGERPRVERTVLAARSTLEVLGAEGEEAIVRMMVAPQRLERDGVALTLPDEQRADLAVGPDGAVRRVTSIGGLPPDLGGGDLSDVVSLLGESLPGERLHLGSSWQRSVGRADQRGRVTAFRVVGGYDCAMVIVGTRRPIVRDRTVRGQRVRAAGTEVGASEIAFALREGFPVEIRWSARAALRVTDGTASGTTLEIESRSELVLERAANG
jgi:hypothetical protein